MWDEIGTCLLYLALCVCTCSYDLGVYMNWWCIVWFHDVRDLATSWLHKNSLRKCRWLGQNCILELWTNTVVDFYVTDLDCNCKQGLCTEQCWMIFKDELNLLGPGHGWMLWNTDWGFKLQQGISTTLPDSLQLCDLLDCIVYNCLLMYTNTEPATYVSYQYIQ